MRCIEDTNVIRNDHVAVNFYVESRFPTGNSFTEGRVYQVVCAQEKTLKVVDNHGYASWWPKHEFRDAT